VLALLKGRSAIRHPRTIATIATTATSGATIAITLILRNTPRKELVEKQKGEPGGSPFLPVYYCRLGSALEARMFRERRAPQERCV